MYGPPHPPQEGVVPPTVRRGGTPPPAGRHPKVKNVFCFKLDAKSVPEALATTILILLKFSIVLVHRQNPVLGPPTGRTPKVKNVFCFKLDAKSIPEALATTI